VLIRVQEQSAAIVAQAPTNEKPAHREGKRVLVISRWSLVITHNTPRDAERDVTLFNDHCSLINEH
jgi:hypothetical protein